VLFRSGYRCEGLGPREYGNGTPINSIDDGGRSFPVREQKSTA
jgi:hypothetical protein